MNPRRQSGLALVAALLSLAAIATLSLATLLVTQLDLRLAANRQALALARAEANSLLVRTLLELEEESRDGELPPTLPPAEYLVYERLDVNSARLSVTGSHASASYLKEALIELVAVADGWDLRIVESR